MSGRVSGPLPRQRQEQPLRVSPRRAVATPFEAAACGPTQRPQRRRSGRN
jgi:hypothetical protein